MQFFYFNFEINTLRGSSKKVKVKIIASYTGFKCCILALLNV